MFLKSHKIKICNNGIIKIIYLLLFLSISTTSSSARTCLSPHFCGQYLTDLPQTIASLKLFNSSL